MQARAKTENIDQYMRDVEQYKLISVTREIELAFKIHHGTAQESIEAKDELITSSLRLVIKIAHDFKQYGLTFADLVQEGNMGLMTAAEKFEAGHGSKFSYYAAFWIRQAIRKAILEQSRTIRVPNGAAQMAAKLSKLRHTYMEEMGRMPTTEESATSLGISVKRTKSIAYSELTVYSLNERVNDDSETTYEDLMHEQSTEEQDTFNERKHAIEAIKDLLFKFPDVERYIMDKAFGLWGKMLPISAIAQETGIAEQDIPVKIRKVCNKLKPMLLDMEIAC